MSSSMPWPKAWQVLTISSTQQHLLLNYIKEVLLQNIHSFATKHLSIHKYCILDLEISIVVHIPRNPSFSNLTKSKKMRHHLCYDGVGRCFLNIEGLDNPDDPWSASTHRRSVVRFIFYWNLDWGLTEVKLDTSLFFTTGSTILEPAWVYSINNYYSP